MSGSAIRLLLADVDGTLVTAEKTLTSDAIAAAQALGDAGIALAITSGRPPRGMTMLIAPLGLKTAIAGFNGGVFVNPDLSVIEASALEPDVAKQALDLILAHELDAWIYTAEDWFIRDAKAAHVDREAWTVKFDPELREVFTPSELAKAVKIVGVSDDLGAVADCERAMNAALGASASAARSQPYYLDVTSPRANKGEVVRVLARRLGVATSAIATIGDMPNDVLMFRAGGLSIAMGNASDDVKSAANLVTESNEAEGFARAVEQFVLPRAVKGATI